MQGAPPATSGSAIISVRDYSPPLGAKQRNTGYDERYEVSSVRCQAAHILADVGFSTGLPTSGGIFDGFRVSTE